MSHSSSIVSTDTHSRSSPCLRPGWIALALNALGLALVAP